MHPRTRRYCQLYVGIVEFNDDTPPAPIWYAYGRCHAAQRAHVLVCYLGYVESIRRYCVPLSAQQERDYAPAAYSARNAPEDDDSEN